MGRDKLVDRAGARAAVGASAAREVRAALRGAQRWRPGHHAALTDAARSYIGLEADYGHEVVDHAERYVNGRVHTNGMENFWSLLKRGLHGTYVSVEPFHLFRYLDERCFTFNQRHLDDLGRFAAVMSGTPGRRLTYAELIGEA